MLLLLRLGCAWFTALTQLDAATTSDPVYGVEAGSHISVISHTIICMLLMLRNHPDDANPSKRVSLTLFTESA